MSLRFFIFNKALIESIVSFNPIPFKINFDSTSNVNLLSLAAILP